MTTPNCCPFTDVPTAFLSTATGTELPNNANRSIGQTDCVGSAGNAPHMAAGVVVYSHVVIVNLRTIISQINSNSNNRY
jgi:hypothetical protein